MLYVEGEPRPEFAFIRRAIAADSGVQLVGLLRSAEGKFLRLGVRDSLELLTGFPTTREELFGYRALISAASRRRSSPATSCACWPTS